MYACMLPEGTPPDVGLTQVLVRGGLVNQLGHLRLHIQLACPRPPEVLPVQLVTHSLEHVQRLPVALWLLLRLLESGHGVIATATATAASAYDDISEINSMQTPVDFKMKRKPEPYVRKRSRIRTFTFDSLDSKEEGVF